MLGFQDREDVEVEVFRLEISMSRKGFEMEGTALKV